MSEGHSHYPILRTHKESSIWRQNDHRDIMQNLSAPFIFQEECRMNENRACSIFIRFFSKLRIRVSEGHFRCVHTIRFSEPTKIGSLKTDRVNGPLRLLLTQRFLTFRYVPCVKIKDTDDVLPVETTRHSRDGNYSFEFCPLHTTHAWKSLSET